MKESWKEKEIIEMKFDHDKEKSFWLKKIMEKLCIQRTNMAE